MSELDNSVTNTDMFIQEIKEAQTRKYLDEKEVELLQKLPASPSPLPPELKKDLLEYHQSDTRQTFQAHYSGKDGDDGDKEEALSFLDFFAYFADLFFKAVNEEVQQDSILTLTISFESGKPSFKGDSVRNWIEKSCAKDLITWSRQECEREGRVKSLIFQTIGNGRAFCTDKFTKHVADMAFGTGNLEILKRFCAQKLLPLQGFEGGGIVEPDKNFIEWEGNNAFDNIEGVQGDKSFVVVVAGESGSGKSVFSCLQTKDRDFLPVYLLLQLTPPGKQDNEDENDTSKIERRKHALSVHDIYKQKPKSEFSCFHKVLREKMQHHMNEKEVVGALCSLKAKLNTNRNSWAKKLFECALNSFVTGDDNAMFWKEGIWGPYERPEKVAVILDEVTDLDLVEGLIAQSRELTQEWKKKLAQKQLILVLTGTGLDHFRYPGRAGSNPAYSRLITLKGPSLNKLLENGKVDKATYNAITSGLFSKILMTNSRMLFRGVLPILKHDFCKRDGDFKQEKKRQRLEERLKQVGSFGPIMDYAARFYVSQNTIGDMSRERCNRFLGAAFLYHLITGMQTTRQGKDNVTANLTRELGIVKNIQARCDVENEELFRVGLVTRSTTSNALKYLACFGLSCQVRAQFGDEFEELTALHFLRLMEVQGYSVKRVTLRHAWPPKANKSDNAINEEYIQKLGEKLNKQSATELTDIIWPESEKYCVIFSQGTPTAQGGDVLALLVTPEGCKLESIQCKHYKSYKRGDALGWWLSLGIARNKDGSWNMAPTEGKAGYSYAGLEAFRTLLAQRINKDIVWVQRTIAVSFPMPLQIDFPIPEVKGVRVWFREMLEPTISTFELRPNKNGE